MSQKRIYKHIGGLLVILDNDGKQNQKLAVSVIFKKIKINLLKKLKGYTDFSEIDTSALGDPPRN